MTMIFGTYQSAHPRLGRWIGLFVEWLLAKWGFFCHFYQFKSAHARKTGATLRRRLESGEHLYLLGLGAGGHNSGAALIRCSTINGLEIIANEEEERYTGIKHCTEFPFHSLNRIKKCLEDMGLSTDSIFACLGTWDYPAFGGLTCGALAADFPKSWSWLRPSMRQGLTDPGPLYKALGSGAKQLSKSLGLKKTLPVIGLPHHDCHAYYSYGVSPFAKTKGPTLVAVIDGAGDSGAITIYSARGTTLTKIYDNKSFFDSLGHIYSIISSTQGGWTPLSSEGRYMGAAAFGDCSRLTNPYYRQLRQLIYFAPEGEIFLNRNFAKWPLKGFLEPYGAKLAKILGDPIPTKNLWNPDFVLNVDRLEHAPATLDRVNKAAALQLVFEDGLFHIIEHFILKTGHSQLVLSGGCALNCVANMKLLEHFDEKFYLKYLGKKDTHLKLWVPPNPGDSGVPIGAAFGFAMINKTPLGPPLAHAFYCGEGPSIDEIEQGLSQRSHLRSIKLSPASTETADLLAFLVASNAVIGLVQGPAETGPRALGHRSILANPCDKYTLERLNARVKHRERIRPLAPMATLEAAQKWFELNDGASFDPCNAYGAYNFMVQTVRAKKLAYQKIPAVIHKDGTSRLQIVRQKDDPFVHGFLQSMGRYSGAEVAVNTSLNIGSPIVQTAAQAMDALTKSRGLDGVLFLANGGEAVMVFDHTAGGEGRDEPEKDGGKRLNTLMDRWHSAKHLSVPVQGVDL